MDLHCENCGQKRDGESRTCPNCGQKFGGSIWVLLFGIIASIILPLALYFGIKTDLVLSNSDSIPLKFLLLWEFPVLSGTAFLYDHSVRRARMYFWIGSILSILTLIWVTNS
jgi:hypothetical protein